MRAPSPKGVLCKHPSGFSLVIPWHIANRIETNRPMILGRIRVVGSVGRDISLIGEVPPSWLTDLNKAEVEIEADE